MKAVGEDASESDVIKHACTANANIQMKELISRSEIVQERLKTDADFTVCSAVYHLETGEVEWVKQVQGVNMEKFLH
jgi:carbonic anhydrase